MPVRRSSPHVTALKATLDAVKASDGDFLSPDDFIGPNAESANEGDLPLAKADLFNLLCIPPYLDVDDDDWRLKVIPAAAALCEIRRAMLIVDPPKAWHDKDAAKAKAAALGTRSQNAAFFFPRLRRHDPLANNGWGELPPCGAVAGIMARTDANRGVWKRPPGWKQRWLACPS